MIGTELNRNLEPKPEKSLKSQVSDIPRWWWSDRRPYRALRKRNNMSSCLFRLTVLAAAAVGASAAADAADAAVSLSDAYAAQRFRGVGGISGGGATSRALFDYPDATRDALLDLLFLPQYGAALTHAKVEIPADADTTCGSEVAHRHDADDGGSCTRGYEGLFLSAAVTRGATTTSSLQWAAPRFVGEPDIDSGKSLFTRTNIDEYVVPWLRCMRDAYNVTLSLQGGGWNERPHNISYIKLMRARLNAAGLSNVGIAAADQCCGSNWAIAKDMAGDPELAACVDVITTHVAGALEENTPTPPEALNSGKPLSQGEEHFGLPDPDEVPIWQWAAAAATGIEISQNWLVNSMSSTVFWPAAYAWPSGLVYRGKGLVVATSPWAAAPYYVPAALFVVAHTTHFTTGDGSWWLTNGTGSGHIGDGKVHPIPEASGGWNVSYVSYVKRDDAACAASRRCPFTLVVESFFAGGVWHSSHSATAVFEDPPATQTFRLDGSLAGWAGSSLFVWHTNSSADTLFKREAPVAVAADGTFTVSIEASAIMTFTTVDSAHLGGAAFAAELARRGGGAVLPASTDDPSGPQDAPFPLPFADDFEGYGNDTLPLFSADMFGAFTVFDVGTSPYAAAAAAAAPPLRGAHPDAAVRAAVQCSTAEHVALRPSRCALPPRGAANSRVLRQWTRAPPIGWGGDSSNVATIYGNSTLVNIEVNVSALIETVAAGYAPSQTPYVLFGIHGGPGAAPGNGGGASPRSFYRSGPDMDFVWMDVTGQWGCSIAGLSDSLCASSKPLPGGFGFDTFHALSLRGAVQADGSIAFSIAFDGALLANASVPLAERKNGGAGGYVGLVTGSTRVMFDNLIISEAR